LGIIKVSNEDITHLKRIVWISIWISSGIIAQVGLYFISKLKVTLC